MDEFHRLVLEEFEGRVGRREWTYVLANGLWMNHRDDVTWLTRHNRASLTGAVRRACKKLAADGYLSAVPPTFKGDRWEFRLTQAGADELDENNTHCLLCEKLIKPGDPCHRCGGESSGEVACEACAPTWEKIREPGFWCDSETGDVDFNASSPERQKTFTHMAIVARDVIYDALAEPTIRSITAGAVATAGGEGRIPDGADNWRALATFRAMLLASSLFNDAVDTAGNVIFESNAGSDRSQHAKALRAAERRARVLRHEHRSTDRRLP